MADIFKKLSEGDYQVSPFKAHKSYTFKGNNTGSGIYWLEGYNMGFERFAPSATATSYLSSTTDKFFTEPTNSLSTENDQYHYKRVVWHSINQLYYRDSKEPGKTSGPNRVKTFPYYGESLGEKGLRYQERFLGSSATVISVPGETYGEGIKPGSVRLIDSKNSITLLDDGFGNLYDNSVDTGSAISDTGLIGWWSFDEVDTYKNNFVSNPVSCSEVVDNSIYGNNTVVSGSPMFISNNNVKTTAGLYIGSDDFIVGSGSIGSGSNLPYTEIDKRLNVRSVSFYFSGSGEDIINLSCLDNFDDNSHGWKIGLNSGKVTFDTVIRSGSIDQNVYSSSLSTNNASYSESIHHCVCQIKDGFKEMYIDGILTASESIIITEKRKNKDKNGATVEFPVYVNPFMKEQKYFRLGKDYNGYLDEVRFYNRTLGSDEISTLYNHPSGKNFVGNVFYSQGLMTLTNKEQKYKDSFKNPESCSVRYKGDVTIYEHEITCNVNKGEFSNTLNRSTRVNWDTNNENVLPMIQASGSQFAPYVTTIGLYDDEYNLIAVGKLSEPVRNDPDIEMTFVVRLDA